MAKHKDLFFFFLEKEFQNCPFPSQCPKKILRGGGVLYFRILRNVTEGRLAVGV